MSPTSRTSLCHERLFLVPSTNQQCTLVIVIIIVNHCHHHFQSSSSSFMCLKVNTTNNIIIVSRGYSKAYSYLDPKNISTEKMEQNARSNFPQSPQILSESKFADFNGGLVGIEGSRRDSNYSLAVTRPFKLAHLHERTALCKDLNILE